MVTKSTLDPEDQQGAWTVSHPLRPNLQHKGKKGQLRSFQEALARSGPGVTVSINDDDAIRGPDCHGNHNRSEEQQGAWTVPHPLCPNLQHKEKGHIGTDDPVDDKD